MKRRCKFCKKKFKKHERIRLHWLRKEFSCKRCYHIWCFSTSEEIKETSTDPKPKCSYCNAELGDKGYCENCLTGFGHDKDIIEDNKEIVKEKSIISVFNNSNITFNNSNVSFGIKGNELEFKEKPKEFSAPKRFEPPIKTEEQILNEQIMEEDLLDYRGLDFGWEKNWTKDQFNALSERENRIKRNSKE
jgi:hypothetical protein